MIEAGRTGTALRPNAVRPYNSGRPRHPRPGILRST